MTGEELYNLNVPIHNNLYNVVQTGTTFSYSWVTSPIQIPFASKSAVDQNYWNKLAVEIDKHYAGNMNMSGHYASSIPDIVSLPKDTSWGQFYDKDPGIDIEKVKERILTGDSDENILKWFARLSIDKLQLIKATVNKKP
jgi:hypothetical protein